MIDSRTLLRPAEAVRYINTYLARNNYLIDFKTDPNILLSENRRARRPNIIKYGTIPCYRNVTGKVFYALEDLQDFCESRLKPICQELQKERLKKADKAAEGARLPYAA